MRFIIHNRSEFAIGLGYAVTGAAFALAARGYELGTADGMGPGYFPFWLGVVLLMLGLSVIHRATARHGPRSSLASWDWRSLLWISSAVVLFALLLKPLGLALSLALLVMGTSLASHEFRWRSALLLATLLVLLNVGLFVHALSLPLPVLPALLSP
ncbi:MAG: tripartite tricarboxylate transporter TctB family protein [Burkholderiaceae bacterium]